MSASMNCMPWKSPIALAELLALLGVADRASSAPWAMPTAWAPIVGRVWSRVRSAVLKPGAGLADDPVAGDAAVLEVAARGWASP